MCLGKILENPESNEAWEQRLEWINSSQNYRNLDRIDGEPIEFEWNIFPGFNTLQLIDVVKSLLYRLGETPENFTGRIYVCRCSTTFLVHQKTTKKNVWQMPNSYLYTRGDLKKDNGHSLVLVLKRSGTVSVKTVHKEYGTILLKGCWLNSQRADVQFSVLRLHCPEVNSKAKDMENCRYILQPTRKRLRLFRIIVSANQLSLYGAVAEICEEYESLHERTGRPVVMGQSIVLSATKTERSSSG